MTDLLSHINHFRPWIGAVLLSVVIYATLPEQDPATYLRFHKFNPIAAYYGLPSPIAQNAILILLWGMIYVKFEAQLRYVLTRLFWSEAASDYIIQTNKKEKEETIKELSRSINGGRMSDASSSTGGCH